MMLQLSIQIFFVILNIATAKYQAGLFAKHKKINHTLWAAGYCLLAAIPLLWNDWALFVSLILLRMPVFNPALNHFRGNSFFYINLNPGKDGSRIDRMMGHRYELIYYIVVMLFIINEVIIYT